MLHAIRVEYINKGHTEYRVIFTIDETEEVMAFYIGERTTSVVATILSFVTKIIQYHFMEK